MTILTRDDEIKKKMIFDSMAPRRQRQILKKGYANWDPFQEPKDPIDLRQDHTKRTSQTLIREFLQTLDANSYSTEYGRGVFEICMGLINENEKHQGMFDFACWYNNLLKKEGVV